MAAVLIGAGAKKVVMPDVGRALADLDADLNAEPQQAADGGLAHLLGVA